MRVLVTRPAEESARTTQALAAAGHEAVIAPIMTIAPLAHEVPESIAFWLATSGNAIRHSRLKPEHLAHPILTVGDATAAEAAARGFQTVHSAQGDSRDLAASVAARVPSGVRIGYLAGRPRRDEAIQALRDRYALSLVETYQAVALKRLPETIRTALLTGTIDAVLHFSSRSAAIFHDLVQQDRLENEASMIPHLFVSKSAEIRRFPIRGIAEKPDLDSLIAALDSFKI